MFNSKVSKSFSRFYLKKSTSGLQSAVFRSLPQIHGLCLMGGAAGFHDSQGP